MRRLRRDHAVKIFGTGVVDLGNYQVVCCGDVAAVME